MKCSQCEVKIPEEVKYCSNCGSKIIFKAKNKEGDLVAVVPVSGDKRLLNYILDVILSPVILFPVIIVLVTIAFLVKIPENTMNNFAFPLGVFLSLLYYVFFEAIWGQTAGKWIMKTIVLNHKGEKITWNQAIIRTISRHIPFEILSMVGKNPVGWHDSLAKTYVVDKKVWLEIKPE